MLIGVLLGRTLPALADSMCRLDSVPLANQHPDCNPNLTDDHTESYEKLPHYTTTRARSESQAWL